VPEIDEVIRDLLHPILENRKRGFSYVKKSWHMDLRPYLWKAIEEEANKQFQAEMVEFIINKLQEKSLRKMIRFVENNKLNPPSRKRLIEGYTNFETPEIREALVKSLKREKSQTKVFIKEMLSSRQLSNMPDSVVIDLIEQLLHPTIDTTNRAVFARQLVKRKRFHEKTYQGETFQEKFGQDPVVMRVILQETDEQSFLWRRWKWEQNERPMKNKMDQYLLDAVTNSDPLVREVVLAILSNQFPAESSFEPGQQEIIFDLWQKLIELNRDEEFLTLDGYTEDQLEEFFGSEQRHYLHELFMFEVHPDTLIKVILGYLPRKKLLQLAVEDPNEENRKLCYEGLTNSNFWFTKRTTGGYQPIGPYEVWTNTIIQCVTAFRFESNEQLWKACSALLQLLLQNIEKFNLRDQVQKLLQNTLTIEELASIKNNPIAIPMINQLQTFITDTPLQFEITEDLSIETKTILVKQYINSLENESSQRSLENMLDIGSKEIRSMIVEELARFIETLDYQIVRQNIITLLTKAENDLDIRIRSMARLLKSKVTNN
jgi:hypothetical protein